MRFPLWVVVALLLIAVGEGARITEVNYNLIDGRLTETGRARILVTFASTDYLHNDLGIPIAAPLSDEEIAESWSRMQPKMMEINAGKRSDEPAIVIDRVMNQLVPVAIVTVTREGFESLMSMEGIVNIEYNSPMKLSMTETIDITGAKQVRTPSLGGQVGYDGRGWTVAVIDDGFTLSSPFLKGKAVYEACFADGYEAICPNGDSEQSGAGSSQGGIGAEHGTHVAGTVLGNTTGLQGMAPGARLIAINVFGQYANGTAADSCSFASILSALVLVHNLSYTYNISGASISIGGEAYSTYCDSDYTSLATVVRALKNRDIAIIVASGNEYDKNAIGVPSCLSGVYAIGASNKADVPTSFSNSNFMVKLFAPGVSIYSSIDATEYEWFDGTSMATPAVSGAFAVYRSAYGRKPTVDSILKRFQATGKRIVDPGNGLTFSRIDLVRAFWINATLCGNGVVDAPIEQCDDNNNFSGDGCSNHCELESLYNATIYNSTFPAIRNDLVLQGQRVIPYSSVYKDLLWGRSGPINNYVYTHSYQPNTQASEDVIRVYYDMPNAPPDSTQRLTLTFQMSLTLFDKVNGMDNCEQSFFVVVDGRPVTSTSRPYNGRAAYSSDDVQPDYPFADAWCGVDTGGLVDVNIDVSPFSGRTAFVAFMWQGYPQSSDSPRGMSVSVKNIKLTATLYNKIPDLVRSEQTLYDVAGRPSTSSTYRSTTSSSVTNRNSSVTISTSSTTHKTIQDTDGTSPIDSPNSCAGRLMTLTVCTLMVLAILI